MVDTTIASTDVTVLGGPSTVTVDVNFGPKGTRGSYIYNVLGIPGASGVSVPSDAQTYDIALNIDSSNNLDYLSLYQYQPNQAGALTWTKMVNLQDLVFTGAIKLNYWASFNAGTASIDIPVTGFINSEDLDTISFNIQVGFIGENPVAHSFSYVKFTDDETGEDYVGITLKASKISGSTVSALTGNQLVHINLGVTNTDISNS